VALSEAITISNIAKRVNKMPAADPLISGLSTNASTNLSRRMPSSDVACFRLGIASFELNEVGSLPAL